MRGLVVVFALAALIALVGCTPSIAPEAAPPVMPSATPTTPTSQPSPTSTDAPSPTPTPDLRIIDKRPLDLILTLEEIGLEEVYSFWFSTEMTNQIMLRYHRDNWDQTQEYMNWLETSGRETEYWVKYYSNEYGTRETILISLAMFRTNAGPTTALPGPDSQPGCSPDGSGLEQLRILQIGDGAYLYGYTSSDATQHEYFAEFPYRNTCTHIALFKTGLPASEEQLDMLVDITLSQYAKLQSMPLSDEFVGYW